MVCSPLISFSENTFPSSPTFFFLSSFLVYSHIVWIEQLCIFGGSWSSCTQEIDELINLDVRNLISKETECKRILIDVLLTLNCFLWYDSYESAIYIMEAACLGTFLLVLWWSEVGHRHWPYHKLWHQGWWSGL